MFEGLIDLCTFFPNISYDLTLGRSKSQKKKHTFSGKTSCLGPPLTNTSGICKTPGTTSPSINPVAQGGRAAF